MGTFFFRVFPVLGRSKKDPTLVSSSLPPLSPITVFSLRGFVWAYTQYTLSSQVLGVYVSLVMFRQVVTPHEAFLTLVALKTLVSCQANKNKCCQILLKKIFRF